MVKRNAAAHATAKNSATPPTSSSAVPARRMTTDARSEPDRITALRNDARYASERYRLYRAKAMSARATSPDRLRELERAATLAEARLAAALKSSRRARGGEPTARPRAQASLGREANISEPAATFAQRWSNLADRPRRQPHPEPELTLEHIRFVENSVRVVVRNVLTIAAVIGLLYLVYLLRQPLGWLFTATLLAITLSGPVRGWRSTSPAGWRSPPSTCWC